MAFFMQYDFCLIKYLSPKNTNMKIQHLAFAACILIFTASCNSSSTSSASSDTSTTGTMSEDTSMSSMAHDSMSMAGDTSMHNHMQACVVMEKGKMMLMDSGKTMAMKEIFTADNGTKVKPNGSYTTADGKTEKLKDGECIMKDGSKTTMDKMPM